MGAGNKKWITLPLLTAVWFLLFVVPAVAAPPPNSQDQELAGLRDRLENQRSQAESLRSEVEALDREIAILVEDYDQARYFLERAQADKGRAEERVLAASEALEAVEEQLMQRLPAVYKHGSLQPLELLTGSSTLRQLVDRIRYLGNVLQGDRHHLSEARRLRQALERELAGLERERERRAAIAGELEKSRQAVEAQLAKRAGLLASVESDIIRLVEEERAREEELARKAAEEAAKRAAEEQARLAAEEKARRAAEEMAQRQAERSTGGPSGSSGSSRSGGSSGHPEAVGTPAPSPSQGSTPATEGKNSIPKESPEEKPSSPSSPPAASSRGGRIVELVHQYLGVPYVWAGASTSGFDCSGLTQYVLASVGVDVPHSSRLQFMLGTPVSRGHLRPGDLVFFGDPVHHVGIFAGGGQFIHAPYTGEVVRYSPFTRSDFVGARRF